MRALIAKNTIEMRKIATSDKLLWPQALCFMRIKTITKIAEIFAQGLFVFPNRGTNTPFPVPLSFLSKN